MALTTAQKINIAKISEYLSAAAIKKGGLFGSGIDLLLPQKIYCVMKSVEYLYNGDPSDDTLVQTSNYLYGLCGLFGLQAQQVENIGGTIAATVGNTTPEPYQFTVAASGTFLVDGDSSKTITAFIGYNLLYVRGNITQSTVNPGGGASYYSWSRETGSFVTYPAVTTEEVIQLFAV